MHTWCLNCGLISWKPVLEEWFQRWVGVQTVQAGRVTCKGISAFWCELIPFRIHWLIWGFGCVWTRMLRLSLHDPLDEVGISGQWRYGTTLAFQNVPNEKRLFPKCHADRVGVVLPPRVRSSWIRFYRLVLTRHSFVYQQRVGKPNTHTTNKHCNSTNKGHLITRLISNQLHWTNSKWAHLKVIPSLSCPQKLETVVPKRSVLSPVGASSLGGGHCGSSTLHTLHPINIAVKC